MEFFRIPTVTCVFRAQRSHLVQFRTVVYCRATSMGFCTSSTQGRKKYSRGEYHLQRQLLRKVDRKVLWPASLHNVRFVSTEIRESVDSPRSETIQSSAVRVASPVIDFYRHYGFTALTVHSIGALVSMMFWWGLTASPVDLMKIFGEIGILTPLTLLITRAAEAIPLGSFIIAYCLHKITAPLRWIVTIALTPYYVRRKAEKIQ